MPKPVFSPLCLRVMLGVTFLWAGLGKVVTTFEVEGEAAARLANAGVSLPSPAPQPQPAPMTPPVAPPQDPAPDREPAPPPPAEPEPEPYDAPLPPHEDAPLPIEGTPSADAFHAGAPHTASPGYTLRAASYQDGSEPRLKPVEPPPIEPRPRPSNPQAYPASDRDDSGDDLAVQPRPDDASPSRPVYTASDFPSPVEVRGLYRLVLLMDRANNPVGSRDDASTPPPIWPDVASTGNRLVLLAWAAAITELVFGLFCLFGFLTRFGAIGFVVTMLVAIWLTEIGPAVQTGATVLGFLPDRPPFDPGAWNVLLWQFALLMSALALLLLGPGRLSIDHLLFGGFAKGDDDDDD